jgi:aspartate/methionine/tyrosine aminotransferase
MNTHKIPTYLIQQWLFDEANGQFEIDLGESGVQYQYLSDIVYDPLQNMNYGLDIGNIDLRNLLAKYYGCKTKNICITHGGQEALYLFYRSFLRPEDHVITFIPGWSQSWIIPEQIGCKLSVISLSSDNNFELDLNRIKSEIQEKTKLIILNYPNNPTGVDLSQETYLALIQLCSQHNIFILNDEEYLYQYENSIIKKSNFSGAVGSLSKIYGFPATRIGWFVGPEDVIEQIVNYRRYVSVCNSNLCELLAIDILQKKDKHIKRYKNLASQGIEVLRNWCKQIQELKLIEPSNTPFAYIILPDLWNSNQFCRDILKRYKVLIMPSSVFGHMENSFRITFARKTDILNEGLERILDHIKNLRQKV